MWPLSNTRRYSEALFFESYSLLPLGKRWYVMIRAAASGSKRKSDHSVTT